MNAQVLQYVAWFIGLIELVVGLYVLVLNIKHVINRHLGTLMLVLAANSFALGAFFVATDVSTARWPTIVLSAVAPGVSLLMLIVAILWIKPQWITGRLWWIGWLLYILVFAPAVLTLIDVLTGAGLLYTGLRQDYTGGVVALFTFVGGMFAPVVRILVNLPVLLLLIGMLGVLVAKRSGKRERRIALIVLSVVVTNAFVQFALIGSLGEGLTLLLADSLVALGYSGVGFWQIASDRRLQRGRLQVRLTLVALTIVLPTLLAVTFWGRELAVVAIVEMSDKQLELVATGLKNSVDGWLTLSVQTLQGVVSLPDVISMNPQRQKSVLRAANTAYPQAYVIMTMDTTGINVARSDNEPLRSYADRRYFIEALKGGVGIQTLIGRTTGRPALVMAVPIRTATGEIVGVGAMGSELTVISEQVGTGKIGETGEAFLVDESDQIIAHSNPDLFARPELVDAGNWPAVVNLRQNGAGLFSYIDEQGVRWRAFAERLENGWGIVVQQQEAELRSGLIFFDQVLLGLVLLAIILIATLLVFSIRQALHPIGVLTDATVSIAAGDLNRVVTLESQDELGVLARAFNDMTGRLRELVAGLESRVAARTADLEQRSRYLQASAEIGHIVTSILDVEQLVQRVVQVIRERFGLYYVALFVVDREQGYAVMRAGTDEAGRARLARGYRLPLDGQSSMIAWCIANEQPRIAQQAEKDAVRLASPELPDTRSEVALPLRSRGQVIGALSLQSDRPEAFDEAILSILQVVADQVAVALDNAELFAERQAAFEQMRQMYGEASLQSWNEILRRDQVQGYRYESGMLVPVQGTWSPEMLQVVQAAQPMVENRDMAVLAVPLQVLGQVIGVLSLRRASGRAWTEEEQALVGIIASRLSEALESARLYWETRRLVTQEHTLSEITGHIRSYMDLDLMLKTAVDEIRRSLGLEEVVVYVAPQQAQK